MAPIPLRAGRTRRDEPGPPPIPCKMALERRSLRAGLTLSPRSGSVTAELWRTVCTQITCEIKKHARTDRVHTNTGPSRHPSRKGQSIVQTDMPSLTRHSVPPCTPLWTLVQPHGADHTALMHCMISLISRCQTRWSITHCSSL